MTDRPRIILEGKSLGEYFEQTIENKKLKDELYAKEKECEELQTKVKNFGEQIKLQNNFIDSLLKATNNSEWLNKTILDDEASEIIEKIELDYIQLDQLKAENENCQKEYWKLEQGNDFLAETNSRLKQTLTEIKEIAERCGKRIPLFEIDEIAEDLKQILQKISECEGKQ